MGFKDGENSIFINENNYKEKFLEYLSDSDNSKWGEIASAGKQHVIKNLTNIQAVESLIDLMDELL